MFLTLLSIQIIEKTSSSVFPFLFFSKPLDEFFYDLLIWFGWIPVAVTFLWGFTEIWKNDRQGKFLSGLKYICLAVDVPAMTEQSPKALENLFALLYGTKSSITFKEEWFYGKLHPVYSFEIVSEEGYIQFIIRTQKNYRDVIEAGIYAQYPDAEISEIDDYALKLPSKYPDEQYDMWGAELTLDKPSHFPIRTYVEFEDQMTGEIKDPIGYTLELMSKMGPGEHFWFQIVIQPSSSDWKKEGIKHVNKLFGVEEKHNPGAFEAAISTITKVPFELISHATEIDLTGVFGLQGEHKTEDDPWKAFKVSPAQQDEAKAIMRKTVKIGHGTKIRFVYAAEKPVYKKSQRAPMIKGILTQYSHLNLNSFKMHIPSIPKDDYFWQTWEYHKKQTNLMKAYQNRSFGVGATPVFLNTEELATLWHFPTINIKAPLIKKADARRAEPPVGLPITFLENTLPGFMDVQKEEMSDVSFTAKPELMDAKNSSFEPLEGALPKLLSPTESAQSTQPIKKDSAESASPDTNFAPPDLPV